MSYAVVWQEDDGAVYAGKLELDPGALHLDGLSRRGEPRHRDILYRAVGHVRTARSTERIGGRPTLVIDVQGNGGHPLRVGSVGGSGLLSELAERLSTGAFAA